MSGPVDQRDAPPDRSGAPPRPRCLEISESRRAEVGGVPVRRALPQRTRRTVGAWCFADHAGSPGSSSEPLSVAPHPHTGLQTVTWLLEGELVHRDSLGSEQVIRPGQLNLMTAGMGVSHSEEAVADAAPGFHGVQLWVAQPEATRHGAAAFEHHAELPQVDLDGAEATVLVGSFAGATSAARADTEHFAADLALSGSTVTMPVEPTHEHAIVVLEGSVVLAGSGVLDGSGVLEGSVESGGQGVEPGHLAYLGSGRDELTVTTRDPARAMLLGGVPFPDRVVMWWNYVGRTTDEVSEAHRDWTTRGGRFGKVDSALPPIDVGPPPWESDR